MSKTKRKKVIRIDSASVRFEYHALSNDVLVQSGDFFTHRTNMRGFDEELYIALNESARTVTARRVILVPDAVSPTGLKWSPTGLDCIFERADCKRASLHNPAAYATVRKVSADCRASHINDIRDNSKLVIHTDKNNRSSVEFQEHESAELRNSLTKQTIRKQRKNAQACVECFSCAKIYSKTGVCKKQLTTTSVR
jgi:hypothetical protein